MKRMSHTRRIGKWILTFNHHHWNPNGTHHGACSNPKYFAFKYCVLNEGPTWIGRRLWLYFRGGYACHFDFHIDRRPRV